MHTLFHTCMKKVNFEYKSKKKQNRVLKDVFLSLSCMSVYICKYLSINLSIYLYMTKISVLCGVEHILERVVVILVKVKANVYYGLVQYVLWPKRGEIEIRE